MASAARSPRIEILALLGLAIAAYANSFRGTFQFDDFTNIRDDPRLVSGSAYLHSLGRMIRPLTRLTFLIDRQLYGDKTFGYHVLNLVLHLACGMLVYGILRQSLNLLRRSPRFSIAESLASLPFWTALLFLVHPVGTETVTYLSGRATGLMTFFYLASFYLFTRAARTRLRRALFLTLYFGAVACFALALLAKEAAITLPVALLLWEYVVARETEDSPERLPLRFHLPFWCIAALSLAMATLVVRYRYLFYMGLGLRTQWDNLVTQINTVAYSLSLFFFPWRLNFDHDLPVYHSFWQWPTPVSFLFLLALVAATFLLARTMPLFSFGLLWFFLQLVPTNSVIPRYDLLSERNLYLASVGIFLAVLSLWKQFCSRFAGAEPEVHLLPSGATRVARVLTPCVLAVVMPLLVISTAQRNRIYVNEIAFWSDAARKSPAKARPHNNLGNAYFLAGNLDRAIAEFRAASQLDPTLKIAEENLAKALSAKQAQSRLGSK